MKTILSLATRYLLVTLVLGASFGCTAQIRKSRYLSRADNYLKAGEYEKAKIEYLNVLRLDRRNAIAFAKIGYIWFEEGDAIRSAAFLLRAKELDPKDFANRVRLGRVEAGAGDLVLGRKEALSVLQEDTGNGEALLLLSETDRSPEDTAVTTEQMQKFPNQKTVTYCLTAANIALHKGDTKAAAARLQEAVAIDPKSAPSHLALAILSFLQNDKARGMEELRTAAELAPPRSTERLKLAEYLNENVSKEEAKAQLKEMTAKTPDYLPAWRLLAQIAFQEKKYEEALSLLENVFSRDPDNVDSVLLQTQVYLAKKDNKKAVDVMERLAKVYANSPIVKFELAKTYLINNNPIQAATALSEAITAQPNFDDAILLLAETNLRTKNPKPVIKGMTDLLAKRPGNRRAQLFLAEAYRQTGQLDQAAEIYRELVKAAPNNAEPEILLGGILRQQQKTQEAREAFEKAIELAPENILAIDQLIDLDLAVKDFDAAGKRAQQLLEKNATNATAHYIQAKVAAAQAKWDVVEAESNKAIELDPNSSDAYNLLISCYLAQNKLQQAVTGLEAVLAKSPESPSALITAALIYEKLGDLPKARDAYEKLLAVAPNTMLALNNLAYLYAERFNNLDRAAELGRRARELQPTSAATADTYGWILYKQGDYAQAIALLEESAANQPDAADVQYHLGMVRYMMGQTDGARAALEKALSFGQDFTGKKEAEERLAILREHPEQVKAASGPADKGSGNGQQANDVVTNMRRAEAAEKEKDFTKAAADYETVLKANPKLLPVIMKLAQIYAGPLQNKTKAMDYAKKARNMDSTDPKIAGTLGTLAYHTGNFPWAYSLLQESTRFISDDPSLLHAYAWAAYSLGKVSEARQAMQKISDSSPQAPEASDAKKFLAMTAVGANGFEPTATDEEISNVLKADGTYAPALMARAALQSEHGQTKDASATYKEVLKQFPDCAAAEKELAAINLEDPAEATHVYDWAAKARKAMPDDPGVARILGISSFKRRDYTRTIQLLQESDRANPLDPKGKFYLGLAYLQTKQDSAGREALEQALSNGLKDPSAAEAKQALADLKTRQQKTHPVH